MSSAANIPRTDFGTSALTSHFEVDAEMGHMEQVYPCCCGETHRGPWGVYDHLHHNCRHRDIDVVPFSLPVKDMDTLWLLCEDCGEVFKGYAAFDMMLGDRHK